MYRTASYDVLIAGAGPAGAHTALRLADMGWRVALLDRCNFPRPKPCGEFLSPACLPLLDELGLLGALLGAGAACVGGMAIESPSHRTRAEYRPLGPFAAPHGTGIGIRREVLDAQAVAAAQRHPRIEVLLGWSVSEPVLEEGRVMGLVVRTPEGNAKRIDARFVVGADGRRSRIASKLGLLRAPSGPQRFALVARFEGVEDREHAALHVVGQDYFAACPIDGALFTANLVVDADRLPKGAANLDRHFLERVAESKGLAARLAGAKLAEPVVACGPLRTEVERCVGPGFALVGDAAGFVDPLTGEGVYTAMRGAKFLAVALDEALRDARREPKALRGYERARGRELGPRAVLARALQRGLRRPGVPDRVVGALERIPALTRVLLALTGDYVPPVALLRPSVWISAAR